MATTRRASAHSPLVLAEGAEGTECKWQPLIKARLHGRVLWSWVMPNEQHTRELGRGAEFAEMGRGACSGLVQALVTIVQPWLRASCGQLPTVNLEGWPVKTILHHLPRSLLRWASWPVCWGPAYRVRELEMPRIWDSTWCFQGLGSASL